jgi:uncharacterized membrane protein
MSDWYYAADNQQKGPINESELKANLASHKLPADTLVWKDGMENWTPANQVPAFTFRPPPTPAAVQPPLAAAPGVTPVSTPLTSPAPKVTQAAPGVNNPDSTTPVDVTKLMGTPEALEVSAEDAEQNKVYGILAYVGPFWFLQMLFAKDSPYAKYHANQGLVLFLAEIAVSFITFAGILLPFIGFVFSFIHIAFDVIFLVFVILGIINAAAGKCVPLPVIGGIKLLK